MLPTPKTSTEYMLKALADKINGVEPVIATPISNTDKTIIGDSWVFQATSTITLGAASAVGGFDGTLEVYHYALDDNGEIAKKRHWWLY